MRLTGSDAEGRRPANPGKNSMPLRVTSLASGSSGNATLIQSETTHVLIDAGIGPRSLVASLRQYGTAPDRLDAVAITHEHSDHIRGLGPISRAQVPLISTAGTVSKIEQTFSNQSTIRGLDSVTVGDLTLTALSVSHDAREPVAYAIEHADARVLLLTDLGQFADDYLPWLISADLIILESNHDEDLLRRGPYPPHLKRRVASPLGHLSNVVAADALARSLKGRSSIPTIWLGHLSDTNNRPMLAVQATVSALGRVGRVAPVVALHRGKASPGWSSDPEQRPAVQASLLP